MEVSLGLLVTDGLGLEVEKEDPLIVGDGEILDLAEAVPDSETEPDAVLAAVEEGLELALGSPEGDASDDRDTDRVPLTVLVLDPVKDPLGLGVPVADLDDEKEPLGLAESESAALGVFHADREGVCELETVGEPDTLVVRLPLVLRDEVCVPDPVKDEDVLAE